MTTNNEKNSQLIYFKGDANVVDGPKFKVALASTIVSIGVTPDAIIGISLEVGSIIANIDLVGMQYGRMIREAIADGLLVVLVDGFTFVGYAAYEDVDPFAGAVCEGFLLGNLSFPMSALPEPGQFFGYDYRNGTDLVPSEQHGFQSDLSATLQSAVSTHFRNAGDSHPIICVISTIVATPHSIVADLIVSNTSVGFAQFDQAFFDELSIAIALGHKSGGLGVDIRDVQVAPAAVDLTSVEAAFFAEDKEASSNMGLIGAVIGVLVVTIILIALAFYFKKQNEAAHWAKVSVRVEGARSANLFQTWSEPGDGAHANESPNVLEQFGLGSDFDGIRMVRGQGSFDKHVDYRPASAQGSVSYFDVGDINSPSSLASPGGHFYPGGTSSAVIGEEYTMGGATSPGSAAYSNGGRASVTTLGIYKDPTPADDEYIVTGQLLNEFGVHIPETRYRPALFDNADDMDDMDEWGTNAWGHSPEPTDHDFPTLKSATLTHGGQPGYAAPVEPGIVEPTPVEGMAVHFAHERGSGSGRPTLLDTDADEEFGMAHIALARVGGTPIPGATSLTSIAEIN